MSRRRVPGLDGRGRPRGRASPEGVRPGGIFCRASAGPCPGLAASKEVARRPGSTAGTGRARATAWCGRHSRRPAGPRPGHAAADGAGQPAGVPGVTGGRQRRDPPQPQRSVPAAARGVRRLLFDPVSWARASALARITSGSRGSAGRSSSQRRSRRVFGLSMRMRCTVITPPGAMSGVGQRGAQAVFGDRFAPAPAPSRTPRWPPHEPSACA